MEDNDKTVYKGKGVIVVKGFNSYTVLKETVRDEDGIVAKGLHPVMEYADNYCYDSILGKMYNRNYNKFDEENYGLKMALKCAKEIESQNKEKVMFDNKDIGKGGSTTTKPEDLIKGEDKEI